MQLSVVYSGTGAAVILPMILIVDDAAPEWKTSALKRTRRIYFTTVLLPENAVVVLLFQETHPSATVNANDPAVSIDEFIFFQRQGTAETL